jgi:5-methylcytosine-specific restriction endonuclease McrA
MARRRAWSKAERERILAKTAGLCHYCGRELRGYWEVDHVKRHKLGGPCTIENALPACEFCNRDLWYNDPRQVRHILKLGVWAYTEITYRKSELGRRLKEMYRKNSLANKKRRKS